MFLKQLSAYAETIAERLPPPMYQLTPLRYKLIINRQGHFLGVYDFQTTTHKRGLEQMAPYCKRSNVIRPKLLVDTVEYTLGLSHEDQEKAAKKHQAYKELLWECVAETPQVPELRVIAEFLEALTSDDGQIMRELRQLDPKENITVSVEENFSLPLIENAREEHHFLFQDKHIQAYWAKKAAAGSDDVLMQCLVCGEQRPPVERLPIVIKGIPGGQAAGLTLISANAPAFESYGLKASYIAPTCEACGEKFGNALNELLRDDKTHMVVSSLAYVFWVRDPQVNMNVPAYMQAEPEQVKLLLGSPYGTKSYIPQAVDASAFYAASLSASGARVVVRDWLETTVGEIRTHLRRYFLLQGVPHVSGETDYSPLWKLVHATGNTDSKEKPYIRVSQELFHLALHGGTMPLFILHAVLQRVRAKRQLQLAQIALIRLAILSQPQYEQWIVDKDERGECMTVSEIGWQQPAYVCGRLLALLDYIQYRALGRVNATIVDRFYGSASTAPAVVFPRLLRNAQPHLTSIRQAQKLSPRLYLAYLEKELALLSSKVHQGFPRSLSLYEQGWFALGFQDQRADLLKKGLETVQPEAPEPDVSQVASENALASDSESSEEEGAFPPFFAEDAS